MMAGSRDQSDQMDHVDHNEGFTRNKEELRRLFEEKAVETRPVTLASGKSSHFYIDGKQVTLDQRGAQLIGSLLTESLKGAGIDAIGGPETGCIPITAAVLTAADQAQVPLVGFWVRKQPKQHGKRLDIEGRLEPGMRAVIVEDVVTTGQSALKAAEKVRALGCTVVKILALVDRDEGAAQRCREAGIPYDPLFTLKDFKQFR